jgi:uncharacterized iron-regulated membrane protein
VLVYRNELFEIFTPEPYISSAPGVALDNTAMKEAARRAHPGYRVVRISPHYNSGYATEVWLEGDSNTIRRKFDPFTGEDVGRAVPTGIMVVSTLMEVHDNFLAGPTGRRVNGIGAMAIVLVAMTGLVIWWPGRKRWLRRTVVHRSVGWKRFNWELHNMLGFWSVAFILVFALSGIYLSFPESLHAWADRTFELTNENAGDRPVDKFLYWLAFSHFGRINGIGLVCDGPGFCDQAIKAIWAFFGMVPAAMFVTGAIMWWNRVLKRWLR